MFLRSSWLALKENYWLFLLSDTETFSLLLLRFSLFLYLWEFGPIFLFAKGGFKFAHVNEIINSSSPLYFCSIALPVRMHWPFPLDSFFCLTIIFSQNSRDIAPLSEARMTFGSLELPDLLLLLLFSLVVIVLSLGLKCESIHYSKPRCWALWSNFSLCFDEPFDLKDQLFP